MKDPFKSEDVMKSIGNLIISLRPFSEPITNDIHANLLNAVYLLDQIKLCDMRKLDVIINNPTREGGKDEWQEA